jgi:hypothetical protein
MPEDEHARRTRKIEFMARNLRGDYGDLAETVGLTPDERDAVLLVLATYRVESMETELANATDGVAGAQALEFLDEQRRSDLTRLLGAEREARLLAFEETVPVRMEMRLVGEMLEEAGKPMSADQSRRLITAALRAYERKGFADPPLSGAENAEAIAQEAQAHLDQERATLLRVAQGILTAEQYVYYARFMEERDIFRGDIVD